MTAGHCSKNVMTLLFFFLIHLIYSVVLVSGDDTFFLVVLTLGEILGPLSVFFKISNGTNILGPDLCPCHMS